MLIPPSAPSTGASPHVPLVPNLKSFAAQHRLTIATALRCFAADGVNGVHRPLILRGITHTPKRSAEQVAESSSKPQSLQEIFDSLEKIARETPTELPERPFKRARKLTAHHAEIGLPPLHSHNGVITKLNLPEDTFFDNFSLIENHIESRNLLNG